MAGTLVVTSMSNPYGDTPQQNTVVLDWLSENGGADAGKVSADICSTFATAQKTIHKNMPQPSRLKGYIVGIETSPGKDGNLTDDLPTALYDITLDDPYNVDKIGGILVNRSGTVGEFERPATPIPIDSEITLEIANAGNSNKGRIILSIAPSL